MLPPVIEASASDERRSAYLLMAVAICIGSFSFTILKVLLRDLSPVTLAAGRVVFSAVAFVVVVAVQPRRRRPIAPGDRRRVVLCGLGGSACFHLLFSWGQGRTSVAVSAVVLGTMPAMVALGDMVVLRHRLTRPQVVGVALSTVGLVVISSGSGGGGTTVAGVIAVSGATVVWAAVTLGVRSLDGRYDEWWVNTPGTVVGAFVMLVVAAPKLGELGSLPATSWLLLVWMGVGSSAFIYAVMARCTVALSATTTASLSTLVTPVSMVIAGIFLSERPGVREAFGAVAVVAGVLAVSSGGARAPRRAAAHPTTG
jgi:drug/metabolite transporter, DME family